MKKILLFGISILLIFSCSSTNASAPLGNKDIMAANFKSLENTSWQLTDISGEKIITKNINGKETGIITLDIADDRISGSGGVNKYFGSYTVDDGIIKMSNVGSTKMMGPEDLMKVEEKYFSILQNVTSFEIWDSGILVLNSDTGSLTFKRVK